MNQEHLICRGLSSSDIQPEKNMGLRFPAIFAVLAEPSVCSMAIITKPCDSGSSMCQLAGLWLALEGRSMASKYRLVLKLKLTCDAR